MISLILCGVFLSSPAVCQTQPGPITWNPATRELRTSSGQVFANVVTARMDIAVDPNAPVIFTGYYTDALIFSSGFE